MIRQDYINNYKELLITQYYNKPKAKQTVDNVSEQFSYVFDFYEKFQDVFDLENATGDRLDKLGAIFGIIRTSPIFTTKPFFNYNDLFANNAGGEYGDLFYAKGEEYTDLFKINYTLSQLEDFDYRFFIKLKILKNTTKSTIQDLNKSYQVALPNSSVHDLYNMNILLIVNSMIYNLDTIRALNILPKPAGVGGLLILLSGVDFFSFGDLFDISKGKEYGDLFNINEGEEYAKFI